MPKFLLLLASILIMSTKGYSQYDLILKNKPYNETSKIYSYENLIGLKLSPTLDIKETPNVEIPKWNIIFHFFKSQIVIENKYDKSIDVYYITNKSIKGNILTLDIQDADEEDNDATIEITLIDNKPSIFHIMGDMWYKQYKF